MNLSALIYVGAGLGLIFLYVVLRRLLVRGQIQQVYYLEADNRPCLILLVDYETSMTSKYGLIDFHAYKLKRIDLPSIKTGFHVKVAAYSRSELDSGTAIMGINQDHLFVRAAGKNLLVYDTRSGKLLGDRRKIEKTNPRLKGFPIEKCGYSTYRGGVVLCGLDEKGYLLDPVSLKATPTDDLPESPEEAPKVAKLSNLPGVSLTRRFVSLKDPSAPLTAFSEDRDFDLVLEDKYLTEQIRLEPDELRARRKELEEFLIDPSVLGAMGGSASETTAEAPDVLVAHAARKKPEISEIFISRVDGNNREHWRRAVTDLAARPRFSKRGSLCYADHRDRLFFIHSEEDSQNLSIAVVDKYDGLVLKGPKVIANRRR